MRRPNREISIFNLSMLDVISGALGAFLMLVVILMEQRDPEVVAENRELRGKIERLEESLESEAAARAEAETEAEQEREARAAAEADAEREREARVAQERAARIDRNLDLVFVMDTTGSMEPVIADLRRSLFSIVRVLDQLTDTLHIGFVAYRDHQESRYLTRTHPPALMDDAGFDRLRAFVNRLDAYGGGDVPEAVQEGLREAMAMPFRREVTAVIVVIGDAPAHDRDTGTCFSQARAFARSGPKRKVSAIFTGQPTDLATRAFFSRLAESGGGEFVGHGGMMEAVLLSVLEP